GRELEPARGCHRDGVAHHTPGDPSMKTLFARLRSYWRGLRRPDQLWAEMDEEMRFHVDMEAERLQRERGLDPAEARRQAAAAFGGVEKYKEAGKDAWGLGWLGGL